jgi:hypothetical protein
MLLKASPVVPSKLKHRIVQSNTTLFDLININSGQAIGQESAIINGLRQTLEQSFERHPFLGRNVV